MSSVQWSRENEQSGSTPSSHALGSIESSSSSLSCSTPVKRSPWDRGITDTWSTVSPLYRGFRVSDCTSLMNVCCLGILDPLSYQPGMVVKLAFWLGPKWLRDIDNSELFFSSDIPLARATAWMHAWRYWCGPCSQLLPPPLHINICNLKEAWRHGRHLQENTGGVMSGMDHSRACVTGLLSVLPKKCDTWFCFSWVMSIHTLMHVGLHLEDMDSALFFLDGVDVPLPVLLTKLVFPVCTLRHSLPYSSLFPSIPCSWHFLNIYHSLLVP